MKSTCISHPARESMSQVRAWQAAFCTEDVANEAGVIKRVDNPCAALFLNHFEYWHKIKIESLREIKHRNDIAENHGDGRPQTEDRFQYHTVEDIVAGIFGIYKRNKVVESADFLVKKGAISIHKNPTERYKFDKTKYLPLQYANMEKARWF